MVIDRKFGFFSFLSKCRKEGKRLNEVSVIDVINERAAVEFVHPGKRFLLFSIEKR